MALPIIEIVFLVYALAGPYLPNLIAHRGYDLEYITSYVAWTGEGIFGTPIGASVSFVVLYIIFGELLDKFGAGKFFIDISYALTGRMRGGPAEASVLSSALMGSINGSAVANVVTTGTFTIPLMKKVGYKKEYAGAVEAVASTGGQILPPVMGAAAFVMADMTGIPYSTIIIAALIPGILYYVSLGLAVYFEAGRLGIQPESSDKIMKARALACIGDAYTGLTDYAKAVKYFEKAASVIDNAFAATYLLKAGVTYEALGDYSSAVKAYETIKEQYPMSMEAMDIDKYITRAGMNAGK